MKKILFIGIDFSKSKFDASLLKSMSDEEVVSGSFENNRGGYVLFLKWVSDHTRIKKEDWLFCGEHTGLYSRDLAEFLSKKNLTVWLENPYQIKCSCGIKRAKTDKIDALEIARYAYRFQDKCTPYQPVDKAIESLSLLLSYRGRLIKEKVLLEVSAKETRRVISRDTTSRFVFENSMRNIERIKKEIKAVEEKMHQILMDSPLKENYLLTVSVKGIGLVTAVALIVHTNNFSTFNTARQLACYCGVVPFEKSSGTSLNRGKHISHLANRELKTLLTLCARCAIEHDKELNVYYHKKLSEGKEYKVIINNVRNKLIHRIYAVVTHKMPYMENYLNPFRKCA